MSALMDLNIVRGENTLAANIFESLFPSFLDLKYEYPSDYVSLYWSRYEELKWKFLDNDQQARGVNGKIFEYILATLLVREGIYPIFLSAKVAFVPNISYDILVYSREKGPICLSAKTSFRERYKQADLEAIALKYVHRRSKSFLITLSEADANSVNEKQKNGDVIGLDNAVYAIGNDFNKLIRELSKYNLIDSPKLEIIMSNQKVTKEDIDHLIKKHQKK